MNASKLTPEDQDMIRNFDADPTEMVMVVHGKPVAVKTAAQFVELLTEAGILRTPV